MENLTKNNWKFFRYELWSIIIWRTKEIGWKRRVKERRMNTDWLVWFPFSSHKFQTLLRSLLTTYHTILSCFTRQLQQTENGRWNADQICWKQWRCRFVRPWYLYKLILVESTGRHWTIKLRNDAIAALRCAMHCTDGSLHQLNFDFELNFEISNLIISILSLLTKLIREIDSALVRLIKLEDETKSISFEEKTLVFEFRCTKVLKVWHFRKSKTASYEF